MDPLSVLSVAGAVVAFVDFGGKVLNAALHYLDTEDDDLTVALTELARDAEQLSHLGRQIEKTYGYSEESSTASREVGTDAILARLARESILASKEVETLTSTLREANKSRNRRVTLQSHLLKTKALRGLSADGSPARKLSDEKERLARIRRDMMLAVLASLWADSKSTSKEICKISLGPAGEQQHARNNPSTTSPAPPATAQSDLGTEERQRQELVSQIWWSHGSGPSDQSALFGASGVDVPGASGVSDANLRQAVIGSLSFGKIDDRKEGIHLAYEKTFQWLFTHPHPDAAGRGPSDVPPWSDFVSWLEREDTSQVYWVTGKPGSGKSTLMKYILECGHLETHLERWVSGGRLRTAAFYSWHAGKDDQRSESGLLRNILLQYLEHMPDLVARVCARRWAVHRVFGTGPGITLPDWTMPELRQAIDVLLTLVCQHDYRLVLFIDGLDEFEVTDNFRYLLGFVEAFRSRAGAKVCVSSRDWPVFADRFRAQPSLRLQDLTKLDIALYIHGHLEECAAYRDLRDLSPDEADRLVGSILGKAGGVFLWVKLVTSVLLTGMENGWTLNELHVSLEQLPRDLSDLNKGIWDRLDDKDKAGAARHFLVLDAHDGPLDMMTMFAAEQPDPAESLDRHEPALAILVARRRLRSQTRGLLEISTGGNVNYLHRSTKDWLSTMRGEILKILPPDFDPILQLVAAKVAVVKRSQSLNDVEYMAVVHDCLAHAGRFVAKPGQDRNVDKLVAVLDDLDAWRNHNPYFRYKNREDPFRDLYLHTISVDFLALTAQFSILPYVQRKVAGDPGLIKHDRFGNSLLECAIVSTAYSYERLTGQQETLLRFLLGCGANPLSRSTMIKFVGVSMPNYTLSWLDRLIISDMTIYEVVSITRKNGRCQRQVLNIIDDEMKRRPIVSRLRCRFRRLLSTKYY